MTTEPENIVLAYLRKFDTKIDAVATKLDELVTRVGHLEQSGARQAVQLAELNGRLDIVDRGVARIYARLNIAEATS